MLAPSPARAACRPHSKQQNPLKQQYAAARSQPLRTRPLVAAMAALSSPSSSSPAKQQQQQQLLSMAVAAAPASALVALALALAAAGPAEAAADHAATASAAASSATPLYSLSEGEDFFANVARYGRYFVTVMLGTGYMMVKPVVGLFKKGPVTAVLALGGGAAALYGIKFTLDAMLGLSDAGGLTYDPDAVVSQALMRMQ
jgi:hypothetical protein